VHNSRKEVAMTVYEIADYFLAQADPEAGDTISNLVLQKLVYYAQGFWLALYDQPLFPDPICKWQHGPVVPDLYHKYKQFGSGPIPAAEGVDLDKFPSEVRELLDEVYTEYGQFSAWKLRDMTHAEPPWDAAELKGLYSLEVMRDYFKTRLKHEEAA
jgi:uncharacterized phage-associated protein